jgi:hypothetical protein
VVAHCLVFQLGLGVMRFGKELQSSNRDDLLQSLLQQRFLHTMWNIVQSHSATASLVHFRITVISTITFIDSRASLLVGMMRVVLHDFEFPTPMRSAVDFQGLLEIGLGSEMRHPRDLSPLTSDDRYTKAKPLQTDLTGSIGIFKLFIDKF